MTFCVRYGVRIAQVYSDCYGKYERIKFLRFALEAKCNFLLCNLGPPFQWKRRKFFPGHKFSGAVAEHFFPSNIEAENWWSRIPISVIIFVS